MEEVKDGQVLTYENKNGDPIIRKCGNCVFWRGINGRTGFCEQMPVLFAYSLEPNMFAVTRKFHLCLLHILRNEQLLKVESKPVYYDVKYMQQNVFAKDE